MLMVSIINLFGVTATTEAKDFGVKGHTHNIAETPFLQMVAARLQNVDLVKERQKMEMIAKDRIQNPRPVEGRTAATKDSAFFFDPTYVLDEDVILPCGKVLYKAGTAVNPLEHMQFNRRLFFIDSREKEQIKWLKDRLKNLSTQLDDQKERIENKIILVGGSSLKLEDQLKEPVYFDQSGVLTAKFGIKHSPALVQQARNLLKIEEFKLKQVK